MQKRTISKHDKVTISGETHTIEEWIALMPELDLTIQAVTSRIRHGMTPQDALTLPRFLGKPVRAGDKGAARDFADYNRNYKNKPDPEPQYEWKFCPVSSNSGYYKKVKVE